jgi:virginiamycin B lyase
MKQRIAAFVAAGLVMTALFRAGGNTVAAQGGVALSGAVTSQDEGKMEGVVVSARGEGMNFTVSVVSGKDGKYSFPRANLKPGTYSLKTRAVGYDLSADASAVVKASGTAKADLTLVKAKNPAAQLSSAEWMMSVIGSDDEKAKFTYVTMGCNYCHSMSREFMSKHTVATLLPAMERMAEYYADGTAKSNDNRRGRAAMVQEPGRVKMMHNTPNWPTSDNSRQWVAEFVERNNLSGGRTAHPFALKMLPRVKGKGTRVIITEYDMPTAATVAHDADLDANGILWYTDESDQLLGRFDTKTATFTEIREPVLPEIPKGQLRGTRDVVVDQGGKVWFPIRTPGNQTKMSRYDPATHTLDLVDAGGQFIGLAGDGFVWAGGTRIDPKTLMIEGRYTYQGAKEIPQGAQVGGYHNHYDAEGNMWTVSQSGTGGIVKVDVKTKQVTYKPVPGLRARRGRVDLKTDRIYFGEYWTDKAGVYDIRADKLQRWDLGKYYTPYTASTADAKGRFYVPSNGAERFIRIDPKTNEIVEYQWPTEFDTKKISITTEGGHPVLYMPNKRTARVSRVEVLD